MPYYAIFDTNVLVSAMLKWNSVPGNVIRYRLQKGNHRKIKGLSALFTRIKRNYIANSYRVAFTYQTVY